MAGAIINFERVPVLAETDIVVAGSGSAGCAAALAAREDGRHGVILLERHGFAGGTSTQILDTFYGFFTPGPEPRKVVGGIPDRVVDALERRGAVFLRPNTYGAGTGVTYHPEVLKLVWDELLAAAGVRLLLHSTLVEVEPGPDGSPASVVIWCKGGFFRIRARRFIDASGDADFCHRAGFSCEKAGEVEPAQTMTTTFRMCNVDLDAFERAGGKRMLMERMDDALRRGTHRIPRKAGSAHAMTVRGCIATVAVRVADLDPLDPRQLTEAEQEGRRQAFAYEGFFRDCVAGYGESSVIGLSHQIGVRESRRVHGEYRLTRSDCLGVARFDDRVLLCGAPIEDHRRAESGAEETVWAYVPEGAAYDVPYRTLVPRGAETVWVAGRCFSATHDAHASCRSMAQTMAMGQAAGFAASLSLETGTGARNIDMSVLQDRLLQAGAVLLTPNAVSRTGADAWKLNRSPSPSPS